MDYPINEMLTRQIALDEMKLLSDAYLEARAKGRNIEAYHINQSRRELRDKYLKVVK